MKLLVANALTGCLLGISLSVIGFSDYEQMYRMLTLADFRMIGSFAVGVMILCVWMHMMKHTVSRHFHPGIIPGGILFGIGWAISSACPSTPLVQLGEGKLWALPILAGVIIGTYAYHYAHAKWFRWSTGSC